jgi:hypothetical protein
VQFDLEATFLDDPAESAPRTFAACQGLMVGDHRRRPFGGTYKIALMMDDGGVHDGCPHDGRRLAPRAFSRLPVNVRGERVRKRTIKFSAN